MADSEVDTTQQVADSEVDTTQQVADSKVDTTQQGTSQTAATKPKIQNVLLRAKLPLKKQNWRARRRKRP